MVWTGDSPAGAALAQISRARIQANDTDPAQATYGLPTSACRAGFFDQPMTETTENLGWAYPPERAW